MLNRYVFRFCLKPERVSADLTDSGRLFHIVGSSEQFLHFCLLDLDFLSCVYLCFMFFVFFHVSLGHFVLVLLAFVVLGLGS